MAKRSIPPSGTPEAPAGLTADMHADTRWFHVFRAMFEEGKVAEMGCTTFTVYAAIKAYTDLQTGAAFPSVDTLAKKCGLSSRQVIRSLQDLEAGGYLQKMRQGRSNTYQLREQIDLMNGDGAPIARASWDYVPIAMQKAVGEIRQVLLTGDLAGAKVVHIEHLAVQVNINEVHPGGTVNQLQGLPAALEAIKDPALRALVARAAARGIGEDATPDE